MIKSLLADFFISADRRLYTAIVIRTIVLLFCVISIGMKLYKKKNKMIMAGYIVSVPLVLIISDMIAASLYIVDSLETLLSNYLGQLYVTLAMNTIILWLIYRIVMGILDIKNIVAYIEEIILSSLIAVFCLEKIYISMWESPGGLNDMPVLLWELLCLIVCILITFIFNKMRRYKEYKNRLDALTYQNEMKAEEYSRLANEHQESRKIIHDMRKHLEVIETMSCEKNPEVQEYTLAMEKQLSMLNNNFHCSNAILQSIVSGKLSAAAAKKIDMKLNISDVNMEFMSDVDITSIFANLFDNAIDAVEELDEDKRKITVSLGTLKEFIVFEFENNYDGRLLSDKEELISTKKEGHMGLGIKIIKDIMNKYRGMIDISYDKDVFCIKGIIPVSN